eukprot:Rmarinus@m.20946
MSLSNLLASARGKKGKWNKKLEDAVRAGHLQDVEKYLHRQTCDPDAKNESQRDRTYLHYAAEEGSVEVIRALSLLMNSVDVTDADGVTPLHFAAAHNRLEGVSELIQRGASVHKMEKYGLTGLHFAATYGHTEVIRKLLEHSADVNAQSREGVTPLHYAAANGHTEAVTLLVESGADLTAANKDGHTPLHSAAVNWQARAVENLLQFGASMFATDNDGNTAHDLACHVGGERNEITSVFAQFLDEAEDPENSGTVSPKESKSGTESPVAGGLSRAELRQQELDRQQGLSESYRYGHGAFLPQNDNMLPIKEEEIPAEVLDDLKAYLEPQIRAQLQEEMRAMFDQELEEVRAMYEEELAAKHGALPAENGSAGEGLRTANKKVRELEAALASKTKEVEVLKKTSAGEKTAPVANGVSEEHLATIDTLQAQLTAAEEEKNDAIARTSGLQADVERLTSELGALSSADKGAKSEEIRKLSAQVTSLQKDLAEKDKKIASVENSTKALERTYKSQLKDEQNKALKLQGELEAKSAQLSHMREDMDGSKQALVAQESKAKAQLDDTIAKYKKLREDDEAKLARADELAKEKSALQQKHQRLLDLSVMMTKRLTKNKAEIEALRGLVRSIHGDVGTLQKNIREESSAMLASFQKANAKNQDEFRQMASKYAKEIKEKKKLFNMVQELRGNIRVYCRIRPFPPGSAEEYAPEPSGDGDVEICTAPKGTGKPVVKKTFSFDKVFGPDTTQESVFEDTKPLITSVVDGYNVCIFAYGQTGSGKTYTMEGPESNPGVNTRSLQELFKIVEERREDATITLSVSILEIYNETVRDLLGSNDSDAKYEIKQGPDGNYVTNLTIKEVESVQEVRELIKKGAGNRSSACTDLNEHSSRSHAMLSIYCTTVNKYTGVRTHGKLHLVDLAGSERVERSGVRGQQLKEAQNINRSLSALGDVIQARQNKAQHTPYRNSKLTHLLQDSLSGNSKTLMFLQIAPDHINVNESVCSLNFASRVRNVELGLAKKNVDSSSQEEVADLRRCVESLSSQLRESGLTPKASPVMSPKTPKARMSSTLSGRPGASPRVTGRLR